VSDVVYCLDDVVPPANFPCAGRVDGARLVRKSDGKDPTDGHVNGATYIKWMEESALPSMVKLLADLHRAEGGNSRRTSFQTL